MESDSYDSADAAPEIAASSGSLAIIFLTVFIDLLGFAMVLPLLPVYAKKFNTDESGLLIATLMASFSVMQFLFAPLWGRLSDRIGRRPVLLVGLAGAAVFYSVFGVATMLHSVVWLFVSRIGAGIACATIPVAQAYIADTTTLENRAKGMALIGAAFGVGFCLGPLIGAAAIFFSSREYVETSPWPGFTAGGLSAVAFLLALVKLPESLRPDSQTAEHKLLNLGAWRDAFATPTVPALLLASFVSLLSFGGFETTLSLLLSDERARPSASDTVDKSADNVPTSESASSDARKPRSRSMFGFSLEGVLLYFSYIGVVLSLAQGVLVRRLSGRIREAIMATVGALLSMVGFGLLVLAVQQASLTMLMIACAVEVTGFSFITPSLTSLVSRRSDPAKQGSIAGVSQSVSALARIAGPLVAIPLFTRDPSLPYLISAGLMLLGLIVIQLAARGGRDYGVVKEGVPSH